MEKDRNSRSETMLNQRINCRWAGEAGFNICREKNKACWGKKKKSNLVIVFSRWIEMQTSESGRHPVHIFLSLSFLYRGGNRLYKMFSWLTKKKHWLYNLECLTLNFILPLGFILFIHFTQQTLSMLCIRHPTKSWGFTCGSCPQALGCGQLSGRRASQLRPVTWVVVSLTRLEKERFRKLGPHGQRLKEGEDVLRNLKGMWRVGDVRQPD